MTESEVMDMLENANEEEIQKILAALHLTTDFPEYAKQVLKVQTPKAKIVPFELNEPQKIVHDIVEKHIRPKRLVRLVALKARRMGFSTYFSGRYYEKTSCNHNHYALQITHEPDATDFLFKMVKRFYNLSPDHMRPETLYNNTKLLEFNNQKGTGLNSAFRVATAGKDDVGSGQLIHFLHLSETAKWKPANTKSLLTSVLQCVPDDPVTEVVFESTAKGIGGEFYDRFWKARYRVFISGLDDNGDAIVEETVNEKADESNIFTSIFLPWFVFEDYRLPVPQDFEITEDEQQVKERFNLSDEQIAWRRWTINNKCDGSLDTFNQEYPDNPMAAFLGSGRPVFNVNKLADLVEIAPSPIARYEYHAGHWTSSMNGRLRVWEEPRSGGYYVIGADVAENTVDGDFCCADVIDRQTGKQVAQWHGNVAYDNIHEYADVLMALGKRYNMAVLAPERNNHGVAVVTQLFHYKYKNLYIELVPDPPNKPRKRYGWVTSRTTKPLIIDNLISELTEGTHGIQCRDTLEEMMSFKLQDNGKMEADVGMFDDRVMSYAIAKYVVQTQPLSRRSYNPLTDSFVRRKKGKRVKREAWT